MGPKLHQCLLLQKRQFQFNFAVLPNRDRSHYIFCLLCKKFCQCILCATGVFHLDKILSNSTELQRRRNKKSVSHRSPPIFCQVVISHVCVCLVSQNPSAPSILHTIFKESKQFDWHFWHKHLRLSLFRATVITEKKNCWIKIFLKFGRVRQFSIP